MKKIIQLSLFFGRITFLLETRYLLRSLTGNNLFVKYYYSLVAIIIGDVNNSLMVFNKFLLSIKTK